MSNCKSPPPRQSQGPQKGFCFLCHSGRLISRSGGAPLGDGGSKAHVGMHSHMPASSFGDILPQGRKEALSSRGHFWGSHSLVDTSPPPAIGPDKSWGPAFQLEGIFQERQSKGNQSPLSALSKWPPDPPLPSPGEYAFRAPGDDGWLQRKWIYCGGGGEGQGWQQVTSQCSLAPQQAHLLDLRSMHNPAFGDREALQDEHTLAY